MIKVTGNVMKSEIANAIQHYNKAPIYAYCDDLPQFTECYHVEKRDATIQEFCDNIIIELGNKEIINTIPMLVIYTNVSDENEIKELEDFSHTIEVYGYVGTVVLMTR